ncbi:CHAT domain-containing protein [Streptomyces sp. NPDC091371]|uniref:CHAT domain-containing protein n=1 Tax=Streptomyces sp. NPDC091371 TaxID=3155303 RepID=UPI00343AA1BB
MVESRAWEYWNRYETGGDIGDLSQVIAAMAGEDGPEVLAFALDFLDRRIAGEALTLDLEEEEDRLDWAALLYNMAGAMVNDPAGLERAIAAMEVSRELHETTAGTILLGSYLSMRRSPEDLRAGLELMRSGLDRTEADHPLRADVHVMLCSALADLYLTDDSPAVGVELAETFMAALAELPAGGPDWTATAELGMAMAGPHLFDSRDPAEEYALSALALAANPPGSADRPLALYRRATVLGIRSFTDVSVPEVQEAVALLREALELPAGPFPKALIQTYLSLGLSQLHTMTGDADLVDEAVDLAQEALADAPAELRTYCLENLGSALTGRNQHRTSIADLNELIDLLGDGDGSALTVRGHGLACAALYNRYLLSGVRADLEESVVRGRRALDVLDDYSGLADTLGNVANALRLRYELLGEAADLDEAVELCRRAVEITPAKGADRVLVCANLSSTLRERVQRTSSEVDRQESLWAAREAMAVAVPGTPGLPMAQSALGGFLSDEFKRTGDRATLDESVRLLRDAVAQTRAAPETNMLGTVLQARFELTGSTTDLNESIDLYRAVLGATEPSSTLHATTSGNLGSVLTSRFRLTRNQDDIGEAVTVLRHAEAHADAMARSAVQLNLTQALATRYQTYHDPADLDASVEASRQAYEALPPGSWRRPGYLAGWGTGLFIRAVRQESPDDLAHAITVLTEAVTTMSPTEPNRSRHLFNLAEALLARGSADSRRKAADVLREAAHLETGSADARVRAARRWAQTAYADEDTAAALEALRLAVELLPLLAWRGVSRTDQERGLAELSGLACDAAALAITAGQPRLAVELLEHGRGVLWAQLLETRTDLTALKEADPALAGRLTEVRAALDEVVDPGSAASPTAADRAALAGEWDSLVRRARELPGFADFLKPPAFATLSEAASHGPVVLLNVSALRCDALIVRTGTVTVLPLPELTGADVVETANAYLDLLDRSPTSLAAALTLHQRTEDLLRWLGCHLTGLVLAALGDTERLWWCPTGPLAVLPIYAGIDPAGACALDQVVSSYTPTLRALAEARSRPAAEPADRRVLVVAMEQTPGAPDLTVQPEVDLLTGTFGDRATVLNAPAIADVCRELPGHAWIHLACHGLQDPDHPSRSGVALTDGILTVLDIAALSLPHSELAFLSACQTAAVGSTLTDEAIHLAAALHTIGYRHVVATLWPVHDAIAPVMAGLVYADPAHGDVATRLNGAARRLRATPDTALPMFWAPYVHIGP